MMRYVLAGAGAIIIALGSWLMVERARADHFKEKSANLSQELATKDLAIAQAQEARDVARAEARRVSEKAAEFDNIREFILRGETNAPLPDALRGILDRLFNKDGH
jgi:hypothetical protein